MQGLNRTTSISKEKNLPGHHPGFLLPRRKRENADEQEYLFAKKEYDEEYARISAELEEARHKKRHFDQAFQSENKWLKTIHLVQGAEEMTPQLVKAVVKAVRVYENKRIEVEFNYEEQRQYLLELAEALADTNDEGRCS